MPVTTSLSHRSRALFVASLWLISLGCTPAVETAPAPTTSTLVPWPDPAFSPERQCNGRYAAEELDRYVPRAKLALWLPGTRSVAVDRDRRCITVRVESLNAGRLAELVIRGVDVPRRAVLLEVDHS